jgi:hypothetical protein
MDKTQRSKQENDKPKAYVGYCHTIEVYRSFFCKDYRIRDEATVNQETKVEE